MEVMREFVDEVADKFGITGTYVIEEYTKYIKTTCTVEIILTSILLLISCGGLYFIFRYFKNHPMEDLNIAEFLLVFGALTAAVSIVACMIIIPINIHILIGLKASPTATVLNYIFTNM